LRQPWRPEQDGFEFSNADLTLWMRRRQLTEQAKDFKIHGWLPDPRTKVAPVKRWPSVPLMLPLLISYAKLQR
jgi:hypothetical protein